MIRKPYAEVAEERHAGIYGPRCPFCGVRQTRGVTDGFPGEFGKRFSAGGTEGLHYPVEVDPVSPSGRTGEGSE